MDYAYRHRREKASDHESTGATDQPSLQGRRLALPAGYLQYYGISTPTALVEEARKDPASPVESNIRRKVEGVTGADLGGVRVRTGEASQEAANTLNAHAYTVGQDVHFAKGQYSPGTPAGDHLIAHELVHTIQQSGGAGPVQTKLAVSEPGDAAELEADHIANRVASGLSDVPQQPTIQPVARASSAVIHRYTPAPAPGVQPPQSPQPPPPQPAQPTSAAHDEGFDPSVLVAAGLKLEDLAVLREIYAQGAKAIKAEADLMLSKGASTEEVANWANTARNKLKQQVRDEGPKIVKVIAEARNMKKYGNPLGLTAEELRAAGKTNEDIIKSATKSNPGVSKWAGRLRIAGRILIAIDIGIAAYRVATTPEVDRPKVLLQETGAIAGAIAGGEAGASGGAALGAWIGGLVAGAPTAGTAAVPGAGIGGAIGGVIGGIGGAIAGAWGGRKLAGFVADQLYPPAQTSFEGAYK